MAEPMKICAECRHSYTLEGQPRYKRCDKSVLDQRADGSLCGEMRKPNAPCGPAATMWEAKDG